MKPNLYHFPAGHPLWDGGQPECVLRNRRIIRRRYYLRRTAYHFGMFLIACGIWAGLFLATILPDLLMEL